MNGRWTLIWALSLLIAAPSYALAQTAGDTATEEPAPEKSEEGAEKAPAPKAAEEEAAEEEDASDEETKAEEPETDAPKAEEAAAEEPKTEEAPAKEPETDASVTTEPPAPADKPEPEAAKTATTDPEPSATTAEAPATSVGASDPKAADDKKKRGKGDSMAAATLGAAFAGGGDKPWVVNATFEQTLGQGAFVQNQQLRRAAYGYAIIANGSYDITKLFEGTLRATLRLSADQQLTTTAFDAGTDPNQFFFRDVIVGLSGIRLYTEPTTGIMVNGRLSFTLPTSLQAQAAERWLVMGVGGSLMKSFRDVGPGSLTFIASESFSNNFAPRKPTSKLAFCDTASAHNSGTCFSDLVNANYSFFHGLTAIYGVGSFSFVLGWTLIHSINYDVSDSTIATGQASPSSSPNALPGVVPLVTTSWAVVSATYVIDTHWSVSAGWSTVQSPYFRDQEQARAIRFPFWNFQDPTYNASSFFLDLNFLY